MSRCDVVIVGSGFAGTILARCLGRQGKSVLLLEKDSHPRFAIGESSTPLAAIALERLAQRYDLPDLDSLAAYGRWMNECPEVGRGLKRGFTFYSHRAGEMLEPRPEARLLVAASPDDSVSDTHWLRSDVDAFLVDRAVAEGVDFRGRTEVTEVAETADGVVVSGAGPAGPFDVEAGFAVDASGPAGVVTRCFGAERRSRPARFRSSVVFSHFSTVRSLDDVWGEAGWQAENGPYPDERAAVHHLIDEGWVYVLPFDHDCVSAGLVADGDLAPGEGELLWSEVLRKYPALGRQFEDASLLRPLRVVSPLQHRLTRAAGKRWAALPFSYSFLDPMFSTGIAWSLTNVERLAALLAGDPEEIESGLRRYEARLEAEADQAERLLYGAHLARSEFEAYVAHTQLYFALVSFEEVRQRIFDAPDSDPWSRSFLGGGDPWAERLLGGAVARLEKWTTAGRPAGGAVDYSAWVEEAIAPRNVAGLADPARRNLYPVDLELLVERASLLGLTPEEMRPLLPRLRGLRSRPRP